MFPLRSAHHLKGEEVKPFLPKAQAMKDSGPIEPHKLGMPAECLPELPRSGLRIVLDQVRSAHNVGALFRTADAGAVELIYLLGLTPHPPQAQLEKTALGATEYVPWKHRRESGEVWKELEDDGYSLVALDNGPGSHKLWDFTWPEKTALVAGNEVQGVSPDILERCQHRVALPMFGYKRSLNVTTALGVAIYEFLRQRRTFPSPLG